jgi:hypothetical protein
MSDVSMADYRELALSEIDGPFRFLLKRAREGLRVKVTVAWGTLYADGTCTLRWRSENASTAVYQNLDQLMAVHGHDGETDCVWIDMPPSAEFKEGALHCSMDGMENCPFSSIGGLEARQNPVPKHATAGKEAEYLRGYIASAKANYGEDWRTCEFTWGKALTIGGNDEQS